MFGGIELDRQTGLALLTSMVAIGWGCYERYRRKQLRPSRAATILDSCKGYCNWELRYAFRLEQQSTAKRRRSFMGIPEINPPLATELSDTAALRLTVSQLKFRAALMQFEIRELNEILSRFDFAANSKNLGAEVRAATVQSALRRFNLLNDSYREQDSILRAIYELRRLCLSDHDTTKFLVVKFGDDFHQVLKTLEELGETTREVRDGLSFNRRYLDWATTICQ